MRAILGGSAALLGILLTLTACGPAKPDENFTPPPPEVVRDSDNDGISDLDEGTSDLDGDGVPDYLDTDTDGDGLDDAFEAGDTDPTTPPRDADFDGTPDVRDLDSDANGRPDATEGNLDLDGDGLPDYADADDDNDYIPDSDEFGPAPEAPLDFDLDGTPDYRDIDSDNDSLEDAREGNTDYDNDGLANYHDTDSDDDCRSDELERAADADGDRNPDFLDRDADNDGLADQLEDKNCNGRMDAGESDAVRGDTDGDNVSDMVEVAAGTDPRDASKNPAANGDFVFMVPYMAPNTPTEGTLDFRSRLRDVDMYVLVDRSTSMAAETQSITSTLDGVVRRLQCPPLGTGDPATCVPNLWAGLGGIGYRDEAPLYNFHDIAAQPVFPAVSNLNAGYEETTMFAMYAAITGQGSADVACPRISAAVPRRNGCGPGRYGYPCFRDTALPVIVLATDEPPASSDSSTYNCPGWNDVKPAMLAASAKIVGVHGSGSSTTTLNELKMLATDTGAVDQNAGNAPLVFNGADATAGQAIEAGIRTLVAGVPLDMAAHAVDNGGDAVDAVAAFVARLETAQLGTPLCAGGLTQIDSNGDGVPDRFVDVRPGTPVCWHLHTKPNTTVPATDRPQLFRATVNVIADEVSTLDTRDVFFLVPPVIKDTPIE